MVPTLTKLGLIVDQFFIHAHDAKKELKDKLVHHVPLARPWELPLDDIRIYFGTRIALYFAFFGVYTKMLIAPAVAGVLLQLYWTWRGGICWYTASVYAFTTPIWAFCFLGFWKQEQSRLVTSWGLLFDDVESHPFTTLHNRRRFAKTYKKRYVKLFVLSLLMCLGILSTLVLELTTPCSGTVFSLCFENTELDQTTNGWASTLLKYGHIGSYMFLNSFLTSLNKFFGRKGIERDGSFTHPLWHEQDEQSLVQSVFTMHFIQNFVTAVYYAFFLQDLDKLAGYMATLMTLKQVSHVPSNRV